MRFSALALSKADRAKGVRARSKSETKSRSSASFASETMSSDGMRRASSGPRRASFMGITWNAPVDISTQASA